MSTLKRLIRMLLGGLMFVAVAINLANVVGRYAFSKPLFWAEEAMVFIQVWCVLIGAALVSYANSHLRMDAFEHLAPPAAKRWFAQLATLLAALVGASLTWVSARIVYAMVISDQRSMALEIPMAIPYAALPAGFAIITLIAVRRLVRAASGLADNEQGEKP